MITIDKTTFIWSNSETITPLKEFIENMPKIDNIFTDINHEQMVYDTIKCHFNEDYTKLFVKLSYESTLDDTIEFSIEDLYFESVRETSSKSNFNCQSYVIHDNNFKTVTITIYLEK